MFAIVYRCRREGRRLDREAIQAEPVRGHLTVRRRGFNKRIAMLLGPDGERYMLPVLDKVQVLAINERGVLLSGYEMHPPRGSKGDGPVFPQVWWCVLRGGHVAPPPSPAESRARERARQAADIGRTMTIHPSRRR